MGWGGVGWGRGGPAVLSLNDQAALSFPACDLADRWSLHAAGIMYIGWGDWQGIDPSYRWDPPVRAIVHNLSLPAPFFGFFFRFFFFFFFFKGRGGGGGAVFDGCWFLALSLYPYLASAEESWHI